MSEEPEGVGSEESSLPSVIADAIGDLVTGVPAPIRKSAIKAFTRLWTAAVEYPVTLIEAAIAERRAESRGAIAERRAESRARVKLIETSANQIAAQMQTDPEYARAAVAKFGQRILRERVNIDQIVQIAAEELNSEPVSNQPEQPGAGSISDDWLNVFETEAAPMTSEQMRQLFGKLLAGEIRRPQSYSIKTVKLAAELDNHAAALFKVLCSLSISLRFPGTTELIDARVVSMGYAVTNSLAAYGLDFKALNLLQEYGLIIPDYNSYSDYQMAVAAQHRAEGPAIVVNPLTYQNAWWALVPKSPRSVDREVAAFIAIASARMLPFRL